MGDEEQESPKTEHVAGEKKERRLRSQVVESRVSEPPAQWIPPTKPPKVGITLRQATRISFAIAVVAYLLLSYVRMRSVQELHRAVRGSATKSTNAL